MNKTLILIGLSGFLLTLGNCDRPSSQASDQMVLDAGRGIVLPSDSVSIRMILDRIE